MIFDDNYYEPPDPPVDPAVWVRCTNPECYLGEDPKDSRAWWNPTLESEYQGEHPMGGYVEFYTDDAFECPECGREGSEV